MINDIERVLLSEEELKGGVTGQQTEAVDVSSPCFSVSRHSSISIPVHSTV